MMKKLLFSFIGMVMLLAQVFAQQATITGKVTSSDGPIPGASIRVKGTSIVSQSNSDGNFTIKALKTDVLTFSYIGYKTVERTVGNNTTINVSMQADASNLNEVVVTAYGIDRDVKSLGYSTPKVSGDEAAATQRNDFFGSLQGRVPGLSINSTNGNPGSSAQIVLRGFVSISGDNNALIVVDGVPINNSTLNQTRELVSGAANRDQDYSNRGMDINPNDIESYVIMKGPEATALYGSAGASGAILITTKKGKAGRGSINYNNSFRVEELNKFPEIQTKYNTGLSNGVYNIGTSNFFGPAFLPTTPLYDNMHNFFETGFTQKHNLSFEGGTDKFSYRWSNEYTDSKGTIPTTSYTRISSRVTAVGTISPILKLTTTFNYINSKNDKANKGANGSLLQLMRFSSAYNVRDYQDANGNRILHHASIYAEFDNPLWDVVKNVNNDKDNRFIANTNIELTPTKWLRINGIIGADIANTKGLSVYHAQSYRGSGSAATPTGGTVMTYDKLAKVFSGSLTASAKHKFGDFNNTYVIGTSFYDFNAVTDSQRGTNMYDPNFYSINNTLPTTQRTLTYVNRYRTVGAFAQAILGYKTLLYLTLSGRVDGASRLMPNNPYFAYPSASLAFNFTDIEKVKENLPWMDSGKLRASFALTGKEPWREYSTGTNYEAKRTTGGGYAYSYYGGNPNLKPEVSQNFEIGTEMQFLKNRIGLDFNFYNLLSKDQIINPRLSYGTGFVLEMMNGGTVRNRGIEVQLTGTPIKGKDFSWNTTFNFTRNRGVVLSLANELPELYESDTWVIGEIRSAVHPGYSTGAISGTRFDRNNNGDILINVSSGLPTSSDTQYYPIGDRNPKFTLGFVNRFSYKSFNLSFLWDLRYGGDVVNGTEYASYIKGISVKTLDRELPRVITGVLADGLQNTANPTPNTIAVTPYYNSNYYSLNVSPEMFVERNIKTLRLRDVTLGYDFPPSLVKRIKFIQSFGAFLTVTDSVLLTNYSGGDPESNANSPGVGGIGGFGIDYGNVGKPIGFNIGFRVKL
ncbi:SusC/RagA family TonB-linked outer membrane protein [Pedobacter sp. MC2016-05]|uniref:SusC/RagA family TonB-linked outer membrane protein n=1 Tax=Pedobacter sp. MC2016-05 TaxID=2994474 RepID=UPI002247C7D5|nr:SusC/RagA family TonB-linked outer membrane protein [Pedobacter sp. MC2016-05]MCX2473052.1 SusC/RagA family TonB-linked outer membrane protein [Pedobacter sp. MC2016-05]